MSELPVPPDEVLRSQADVAAYLNVPIRALEMWRHRKIGPPYIKLGDALNAPVRYRIGDVQAWLDRHAAGGDAA